LQCTLPHGGVNRTAAGHAEIIEFVEDGRQQRGGGVKVERLGDRRGHCVKVPRETRAHMRMVCTNSDVLPPASLAVNVTLIDPWKKRAHHGTLPAP
jgi:hypothetical protein